MRDHDKVYSSVEDLLRRHENFVTNVEKAEDYQREDSGTAVFEVNKFFDLSGKLP
jgi:Cathepsin propeptide inhibitor domain (I29).